MPWANFLWPTTDVHLWQILNEPIVFNHSSHINGVYVKNMDKIRALAWMIQNHRRYIKFRIEQHKVIFYSTKKIIHEIINAFWEEWVDTQSVNLDYLKKLSKDQVLCKRLPHNKYQYQVHLNSRKQIPFHVRAGLSEYLANENIGKCVNKQMEAWLVGRADHYDGYFYVKDEKCLSMIYMLANDVIDKTIKFVKI